MIKYAEKEAVAAEEEHQAENRYPSCGNHLNLVTRIGLHSPENESWRVICDQCNGNIDADALEEQTVMHYSEV